MLGAEHKAHTFPGLIPGRLYRAEVITHSGELTNSVSALGRTGESQPNNTNVNILITFIEHDEASMLIFTFYSFINLFLIVM